MFIPPDTVDWFKYAIHCHRQGIKLNSRYRGVYISFDWGKPKFIARYNGVYLGLFPMTAEGELAAATKHAEYRKDCGRKLYRGRIIKGKIDLLYGHTT